jgi:RNA polymerase sigma-70 factor (ECF subfamily)
VDILERRDFDPLFREIGPALWRAIYVYSGGRREIADDAVAEAFARAIEHEGEIRRVFPWLYRVAFRLAAAEIRRWPAEAGIEEVREDRHDVEDVLRALRELSPGQRGAVFLHYHADLPIREVAKVMGTSTAAVKVHLHRGRKRLRELLGDEEVSDA